MISIYRLDRKLADVDVINDKLHVVSYDGDWVEGLIEELRSHVFDGHLLPDQELYDSLPERLQGMTWASLPTNRRSASVKAIVATFEDQDFSSKCQAANSPPTK